MMLFITFFFLFIAHIYAACIYDPSSPKSCLFCSLLQGGTSDNGAETICLQLVGPCCGNSIDGNVDVNGFPCCPSSKFY